MMNRPTSKELTAQLRDWQAGHECALDQVIENAHARLLEIARRLMANEVPGHTLPPAGLVNEVYLRINELRRMQWRDRQHFFSVSANLMRRILIDHARARSAAKRGGELVQVTLDEAIPDSEQRLNLLELDEALTRLEAIDPLQVKIVELRFFGGMTIAETAEQLAISAATVKRKWVFAQAWLYRELQ